MREFSSQFLLEIDCSLVPRPSSPSPAPRKGSTARGRPGYEATVATVVLLNLAKKIHNSWTEH